MTPPGNPLENSTQNFPKTTFILQRTNIIPIPYIDLTSSPILEHPRTIIEVQTIPLERLQYITQTTPFEQTEYYIQTIPLEQIEYHDYPMIEPINVNRAVSEENFAYQLSFDEGLNDRDWFINRFRLFLANTRENEEN